MLKYLDLIINFLTNMIYLIGLWFLVSPLLLPVFKSTLRASRFRRAVRSTKPAKKSAVITYIEMLLNVTMNTKTQFAVYSFFMVSASLFLTVFLLLINEYSFMYVFLFSTFAGSLPFLFLILRLNNYRVEGSYEGVALVSQLTDQYKINSGNMKEAIDKSLVFLKNSPYSSKALYRLSFSIKNSKNNDEIERSIMEFVFAFATDWAQLLGMNMLISIIDGADVKYSLEDILTLLKRIKENVEKTKRTNNEAYTMIKILIPFTYLASVYFAVNTLGFSYGKFLDYQFRNPLGLKFAVITYTMLIICFIFAYLIRKPKYDY